MRYIQIDGELVPADRVRPEDRKAPDIVRDADFVTEDITGQPVRITSRRQLRRLCKEHNVEPMYGKGWW